MHGAPSVSYPVGRSRLALLLLGTLALLAAASLAAWAAAAGGWGTRHSLAAAIAALAGGLAFAGWWQSPRGRIAWDGEAWRWMAQGEGEAGEPVIALDLQRELLLHWRGGHSTAWLWASADAAPSDWAALRRAVYSRASSPAQPPSRDADVRATP
jgi:hypothetical protein